MLPTPKLQNLPSRHTAPCKSKEAAALAKELLSKLPGLQRAGIGRNLVWEPLWKEGDEAGSFSTPEGDEQPGIQDLLKSFEGL